MWWEGGERNCAFEKMLIAFELLMREENDTSHGQRLDLSNMRNHRLWKEKDENFCHKNH